MIFGGWPSHSVWIITCTSEMSGRASSGIFLRDQIPAMTSRKVPVKTRKRFPTHHSMTREIISHPPFGSDGGLLRGDHLTVFHDRDRDLPGAAGLQGSWPFVESVSLFGQRDLPDHGSHAHLRHRGHEIADGHLSAGERRTACINELHAKDVAPLVERRRLGGEFDLDVCFAGRAIHRRGSARARRRWHKRSEGRL